MPEHLMTPVAPCKFAWLNKPDVRWKKDTGEYKVNLVFDQDDPFVAQIEKEAKAAYEEANAAYQEELAAMSPRARKKAADNLEYFDPIIEEDDENGELTGNVMLNFKTSAKIKKKDGTMKDIKLNVFDSFGRRVSKTPNIGSGSELVIAYKPKPNVANGKFYFTLYLNAVQVVKLVEFSGGNFGFKQQGDGFDGAGLDEEETGTTEAGDETEF